MNECAFGTKDPVYLDYHDHVWGQPLYDSKALFKLLALESQHAGLSWLTILKKKEAYEEAFYDFEPEKVAQMTAQDIDRLMTFPNIVHHRKKLEAIVNQAQGYLKIEQAYGSFSKFLWSYVNGKPKDLKQYGFKFLGPVTVFSFLEAAGLYDAHLQDCPSKPKHN
ncbi:TPA: DNA-3-methyladenine glycosylase I [Staphylococcus aureus]|uniref:DNA-3-methyladenine glycosylase I n=1 Tax=Staphylococcus aureus TaxID=1280 RepID=UPI0007E537E8|nr:DNA-3-methyladenine glycosylase I [Staphylococcus aureus]HDK3432488.1 DNA-3-methyladenine glycosylase I [Staphylococcus aureus]HDK3435493.1 DNA-3-methyladenine glycosylase I [Staphylococcus aureus]HDK3437886.1 DNA-3-methyladenine glycosylase I [Staphylococcus aureus]HDK3440667.1 DNA-3-methyladenine glycosylase I [Staphylococcus aureus]HDK3443198.1 DNA-3-methyladenine glycosylase I [Staphylococcus aureus]